MIYWQYKLVVPIKITEDRKRGNECLISNLFLGKFYVLFACYCWKYRIQVLIDDRLLRKKSEIPLHVYKLVRSERVVIEYVFTNTNVQYSLHATKYVNFTPIYVSNK